MAPIETIDEYIKDFSAEQREIMQKMREVIKSAVPDVIEKMSWGMPTFYQNGNLLHFAACKKHLGLYPGPVADLEPFQDKIAAYTTTKGSIHFDWDKPAPYKLVAEITRFRVKVMSAEKDAAAKVKKSRH
jgi:uncharacterized protein YdhG (YjbR/CyaY superfamily)